MFKRFVNGTEKGFAIIRIYTFILAMGLFFVIFWGGSSEFEWMYSQLISYIIYAFIVILSFFFLVNTYGINHLRRRLKKLQETGHVTSYMDLTDEKLDFPAKFQDRVSELETLGFQPFAVLDTSEKHDRSRTLWYWTDDSHTVRAYLSLVPPFKQMITAFITVMEDEGTIETAYNVRMQMDTDSLHVRNVTTSLSVAYDFHLQQIVTYESQHGQPIAIRTSTELVEWSNHFEQKQHPVVYKNRIENLSKYTMLYGALVIGFILALFISQWIDITIAVGITGIVMGVGYNMVSFSDVEDAFGSVEARKKKKN